MSSTDHTPLSHDSSGSPAQGLAPPFEPVTVSSSSSTVKDDLPSASSPTVGDSAATKKKQKKDKMHHLFSFGKKKNDDAGAHASLAQTSQPTPASSDRPAGAGSVFSTSPPPLPPKTLTSAASGEAPPKPPAKDPSTRSPASPALTDNFSTMSASNTSSGIGGSNTTGGSNHGGYYVLPPASPGRSIAALSSSPRLSSPAGSQIFERDVQESGSVPMPSSPAIPSHIATENYIPPVLDASSEAITDDHLDPDTVEIITHAHHQPAALNVVGVNSGAVSSSGASVTGTWVDDVASSFVTDKDDSASNYGSFDTNDVRRLSFISFADVVQAEHQQHQHSPHQQSHATASPGSLAGLANLANLGAMNRSPSPMRSPTTTDRLGTSPPASKSGSIKGLELSPPRKPLGSPARSPKIVAIGSTGLAGSASMCSSGEISVETMSDALRRTGSGDFSGLRSTPHSPI